jgi:predicted CopG family antitoxin
MKNLTITITDAEFEKLGINKETLSFSELFEIIKDEISKQNFTGIDPNKFESIVNEMEIEEPVTVLIKAAQHEL